jgi:hypothetical protein
MRMVAAFMLCWGVMGCDRPVPSAAAGKRPTTMAVEITRVTPLPPNHRTHVTSTGNGQIFWVQEADSAGRETVFAISEGGLPSATRFSNASILEALGQPDAAGNIQSMVAGADGKLYFYFLREKKKVLLAALGTFSPETGKTQVIADTEALARGSAMGNVLGLARGSVVRVGNVIWLWLRHEIKGQDAFALLSLEPGVGLRRRVDRVRVEGGAVQMTSAREDLAAGLGDWLIYLDRGTGKLWKVTRMGEGSMIVNLSDLPKEITAPSWDERGRMAMFAPEGLSFVEGQENALGVVAGASGGPQFPAMILFEGEKRVVLDREKFSAPASLNVRNLAIGELVRDRSSWLGYDAPTGELLRVRIVEK